MNKIYYQLRLCILIRISSPTAANFASWYVSFHFSFSWILLLRNLDEIICRIIMTQIEDHAILKIAIILPENSSVRSRHPFLKASSYVQGIKSEIKTSFGDIKRANLCSKNSAVCTVRTVFSKGRAPHPAEIYWKKCTKKVKIISNLLCASPRDNLQSYHYFPF